MGGGEAVTAARPSEPGPDHAAGGQEPSALRAQTSVGANNLAVSAWLRPHSSCDDIGGGGGCMNATATGVAGESGHADPSTTAKVGPGMWLVHRLDRRVVHRHASMS